MKKTYLVAYAWPHGQGRATIQTPHKVFTEAGIIALEAHLVETSPELKSVAILNIIALEDEPTPEDTAEDTALAELVQRYTVLGSVKELTALVDQARPVKPYKESMSDRLCNACGSHLPWDAMNDALRYAPKFCPNCGQALDWSGENE